MKRYVTLREDDVADCIDTNWEHLDEVSIAECHDLLQAWTQCDLSDRFEVAVYDRDTGRVYYDRDLREIL